jgi:hypothetical protein
MDGKEWQGRSSVIPLLPDKAGPKGTRGEHCHSAPFRLNHSRGLASPARTYRPELGSGRPTSLTTWTCAALLRAL